MSEPHVEQSLEAISQAMDAAPRGVVAYSGGKESVVLKHVLKPWADRLEFVWVNTGAMLPHMRDFILEQGVTEVQSDQAQRFKAAGLPSRVVPIFNTPLGSLMEAAPQDRLLVSDWVTCCLSLRSQPIELYMREHGIGLEIHGQRAEDGVAAQYPRRILPLWNWTEQQVYSYVREHRLELPQQYSMGYPDSGECWNCTAQVSELRFTYLAAHHPEQWQQLRPSLLAVYGALDAEHERTRAALDVLKAEETQP